MSIEVNGATSEIRVNQSDTDILTYDAGNDVYICDTDALRLEMKEWEATTDGIVWTRTHSHNTTVTISGTTFVRSITILSPWQLLFYPDTEYTVLMDGASNNNYHDKQSGILKNDTTQVIPQNSAGNTITETGVSGLTPQEAADLAAVLIDVSRARKHLTNRQELVYDVGEDDIRLVTYQDDGSSVLDENVITDPNDNDPALASGAATKRGAPE